MQDYLLLIDGSSLLTTQFFGNLPADIMFAKTDEDKAKFFYKIMQTSNGTYTNAVFGFMRTLIRILKDQRPAYLAIAWDMSRDTFRRELYPDYKGNRSETLPPLGEQFGLCQSVLERLGVRQFMSNRYEADDYCGTLASMFEKDVPVRILTKDNDYLQLVTENTNLWMMHATAKKTEELYKKYRIQPDGSAPERCFTFTPELVREEFGIDPESVPDLKGLQGDTSDNIKGVPGVGPATAVALIAKYRTIEELYSAMEGLDDKQLKELAVSWKEIGVSRSPINNLLKEDDSALVGHKAALLSKKLATIKKDIDLGDLRLDDLRVHINKAEAVSVFNELEFKTLKPDFPEDGAEAEPEVIRSLKVTSDMVEAEELIAGLSRQEYVGVAVWADAGTVLGAAFTCDDESTTFVRCENFIREDYIRDILRRVDAAGTVLVFRDLKLALRSIGELRLSHAVDLMLGDYLIDPIRNSYELQDIARTYGAIPYKGHARLGKLKPAEAITMMPDECIACAAEDSGVLYTAYRPVMERLSELGLMSLYKDIEMPLIYVLADMEREGVLVDCEALRSFAGQLDEDIRRLERSIYDAAGEEFNINSPRQLGVILFEKLGLESGKKTKTGYSTSAEVLEQLRGSHPIIDDILEYRTLSKLKSTYADGLFEYIDADGRIRTTFNQTVTATGRLSSTEPNIQNIPVRTELGRLIRKAFIPAPGYVFVDADYSQIELRILASMSGDEQLIRSYRNSEDIHRATASAVFHVPYEEVTPELRRRAKAVNFGIVYGMSFFGLGNELGIGFAEAEKYIRDYYATYPAIKAFLDGLVASAKDLGYAKTMYGRRRAIPELTSSNYMQRQFGERVAMNSPIQGTAADVIKIAMLKVSDRLKRETPHSKLILQVHDELLVEARAEDVETVKRILAEEMEHAADMAVTLEVDVETGADWCEAH